MRRVRKWLSWRPWASTNKQLRHHSNGALASRCSQPYGDVTVEVTQPWLAHLLYNPFFLQNLSGGSAVHHGESCECSSLRSSSFTLEGHYWCHWTSRSVFLLKELDLKINCCPGRWPNTGWAPTRMPWRRQKIRPSNLSFWVGRNEKYAMKHLHYNEWNPRYVCESGSSYRLPHWDLHQRLCLWGRLNSLWLFRRSSYSSCAKMFIHRSSGWSSKRHWSRSKDLMISWRTPQR